MELIPTLIILIVSISASEQQVLTHDGNNMLWMKRPIKNLADIVKASLKAKVATWQFGGDVRVKHLEIPELYLYNVYGVELSGIDSIDSAKLRVQFTLRFNLDVKTPLGWIWVKSEGLNFIDILVTPLIGAESLRVKDINCNKRIDVDTPWYITHGSESEIEYEIGNKICQKVLTDGRALIEDQFKLFQLNPVTLMTKGNKGIELAFKYTDCSFWKHVLELRFDMIVLTTDKEVSSSGKIIKPWKIYPFYGEVQFYGGNAGLDLDLYNILNAFIRAAHTLNFIEDKFEFDNVIVTIPKEPEFTGGFPPIEIGLVPCPIRDPTLPGIAVLPSALDRNDTLFVRTIVTTKNISLPLTITANLTIFFEKSTASFSFILYPAQFQGNDFLKNEAQKFEKNITSKLSEMLKKQMIKLTLPSGIKVTYIEVHNKVLGPCEYFDEYFNKFVLLRSSTVFKMNLNFN